VQPATAVALLVAVLVGALSGALVYRAFDGDSDAPGSTVRAPAKPQKVDGKPAEPVTGFADGRSGEPGTDYEAQFATDSMYPRFNPERRFYVTRCAPGKVDVNVRSEPGVDVRVGAYPPRSGDFTAEARPLPGQAFTVTIDGGGDPIDYTVRCLPAGFPEWTYERVSGGVPKGMFMVSFRPKPQQGSSNWSIVFDQEGTPRWWLSQVFNTLGGQVLPDGTVQSPVGFGDGFGQDGRTVHQIRTLDGRLVRTVDTQGAPLDGHEYTQLDNGNVLIMSYKPRLGVDLSRFGLEEDGGVLDGEIQEVTPGGEVVWKWNSSDHVSLDETPERWWRKIRQNPHFDGQGRVRYDTFHLNSIEPWGDQYVISARHTDRVFGISNETGEVLWTFGGGSGPKALKLAGDDPYAYPVGGQHDARMEGDVLSVHDNGTNLEGRKRPPRLLRYRIDLENRTATFLSAVEDAEAAPTSHCCGSARPFGDGWIVAWGNTPVVSGFGPGDELAFRLRLPVPVYRAVPVPEAVSEGDFERGLADMESGPPQSGTPVRPFRDLPPDGG
jgi:hypothetical protein